MLKTHPVARSRAALATLTVMLLSVIQAHGQTVPAAGDFEPRVGQAGKDVIWVPTPNALVDRMLQMANVGPNDRLVDLGSGDGRIAIAAARDFKIPATGIEYNPDMVALSNRNAREQGVSDRAKFIHGDIFEEDFSDATVVTMYLLPSLNLRLRPKLLEMKPGTRLVSHAFTMEDWRPDGQDTVDGQSAYFWIVPAQVGGTWRVQAGSETLELKLYQTFQDVKGTAGTATAEGSLKGEEIQLTLSDTRGAKRELSGKVAGNQMTGRLGNAPFTATRMSPAPGAR